MTTTIAQALNRALDDALASEIKRISGSDVNFVLAGADGSFQIPATTLDAALADRLATTAEREGLAVPVAGGHRQHLVLLLRRDRAATLVDFYAVGGRAIRKWLDAVGASVVDMDDVADAFLNVNTPEDLARAEQRLATRA